MRTLAIALSLACSVPALAAQSFPVDAVDPAEMEFPGGRGADMIVIYTSEIGRETTGTNEWGAEAVVRRGVVTDVGRNDSPIPADGFVVSGHGTGRNWINENLTPGTPVVHDGETVRVDTSDWGRVLSLRHRSSRLLVRLRDLQASEELNADAEDLAQTIIGLGHSDSFNDPVNGGIDQTILAMLTRDVERLEREAWLLELAQVESPSGEIRAVWHRVAEASSAEITAMVEDLAATHINVFLPEVIYGSQCIGIDETGLFPLFERFGGHDALAQIIEECHARGIEVHAWIHCFYIGIPRSEEPPLLAESHPEWLAQDRQGRRESIDETGHGAGYMFINPAHPRARRALIDAYVALVRNYDLDGLQLDYIRYPNSFDWENQWDYSDLTRERIRMDFGFDPMEITPESHPRRWSRWLAWREETITSFVQEAVSAIRAVDPDITITSAVFPDLNSAIVSKGQNWAAWEEEGLMTAIMPMAYSVDPANVAEAVSELQMVVGTDSPTVIGIGPYLGLTPQQLVEQIVRVREAGASGQALFAWDTLDEADKEALRLGPWRSGGAADWEGDDR